MAGAASPRSPSTATAWTGLCGLPKGGARRVTIRWSDKSDAVRVAVPGRRIGEADREFLRSRVRWMFRADEDFGEFWELCRGHAVLRHCRSERTGALLRCATVFEDVVKTICTVNCSWSNTKLMVSNLCRMFGEPCVGDGEAFTFPTPEQLAAVIRGRPEGGEARVPGKIHPGIRPAGSLAATSTWMLGAGRPTPLPCGLRSWG